MSQQNIIHLNGKVYDASTGKPISRAAKKESKKIPEKVVSRVVSQDIVKPVSRSKNHHVHHRTQRSKTLIRSPLNKPHHTSITEAEQPKTAHVTAAQQRLERAKSITRSPSLAKYAHNVAYVEKRIGHVPVAKAPHTSEPSRPISKSEEMFNRALASADSHRQKPYAIKKRRAQSKARPAFVVIAAILLIGFFGYQNLPNLSLRIASSRSGFSAKFPGYTPSGFSAGPINYETGKIAINFKSNTNDNTYRLTQKVSSWNSEALLHNYIIKGDFEHQSVQVKGKTLFFYGNSSATWVNGGVWFNVESENLTNEQLYQIASSI